MRKFILVLCSMCFLLIETSSAQMRDLYFGEQRETSNNIDIFEMGTDIKGQLQQQNYRNVGVINTEMTSERKSLRTTVSRYLETLISNDNVVSRMEY